MQSNALHGQFKVAKPLPGCSGGRWLTGAAEHCFSCAPLARCGSGGKCLPAAELSPAAPCAMPRSTPCRPQFCGGDVGSELVSRDGLEQALQQ